VAIEEAYMPRFGGDAIAPSKLGQVLAIAERLDTLAGGFAAGLKPTGNKDAFALRRNALGLARTFIEARSDLNLNYALKKSLNNVRSAAQEQRLDELRIELGKAGKATLLNKEEVVADITREILLISSDSGLDSYLQKLQFELSNFIVDRLRSYYDERGVPPQQFEAVAALRPSSLLDFDRRLAAIGEFATLPEAEALAAANKRIRNILKKVEGAIATNVDPSLLEAGAERDLAEAVGQAMADTDDALAQRDYVAVLGRLARLRPQVDAFFDAVMVNVDDPAVRNNRLALLQRLADRLGSVAAIEHLST